MTLRTCRAVTRTGLGLSSVVPMPNWPLAFLPNVYSAPVSDTARECVSPPHTRTMRMSVNALIWRGKKTSLQSPCPRRPKSPLRHRANDERHVLGARNPNFDSSSLQYQLHVKASEHSHVQQGCNTGIAGWFTV